MRYQFKNEIVLDILHKGLWDENREIEKSKIINFFVHSGYPVLEKVIEFLQSFYCLSFNFYNKKNGKIDNFDFDVIRASELLSDGWLENEYIPRIGKQVSLIGTAYREHFVLLMDIEGSVYGAYDSFLVKIADSGEKAIEAIIFDYDFVELQ